MFTIGIAGGTGAGKTTFINNLYKHFQNKILILSHDSYYKDLSHLTLKQRAAINFDHPNSLETSLLIKHIKQLKKQKSIKVPVYDFKISNRTDKHEIKNPKPIIFVEGILIFSNSKLCNLFDLKVFIETEADIRLGRRIKRDINERGRTVDFSLNQYLQMSKPMHEQYVEPSKKHADLIVPQGGMNEKALKILIYAIERHLQDKN